MSDPDEFSDATELARAITSSTSYRTVDLDSLSPRAQSIKLLLADEMSDGYNLTTLANELGLSPSSASALLSELKNELELQSGPLFPLSEPDYEQLKESIAQEGVRVPVIIGERGLIDGRHRWRASLELGLREIPAIFLPNLSPEEEHDVAIAVNTLRRHLTRDQKNALVRAELQRDWSRSDRRIAAVCGVSHPTVAGIRFKVRQEEEAEPTPDDVDAVKAIVNRIMESPVERVSTETRVGSDGRVFDVPVSLAPGPERPLGYVNCGRCSQRHALYRDGGGYRMEVV
jgi:hypothetical protein